jgi:hypothetical protein
MVSMRLIGSSKQLAMRDKDGRTLRQAHGFEVGATQGHGAILACHLHDWL